MVTIPGCAGHTDSVTTTQPCCGVKTDTHNTETNERWLCSNKTLFTNTDTGNLYNSHMPPDAILF